MKPEILFTFLPQSGFHIILTPYINALWVLILPHPYDTKKCDWYHKTAFFRSNCDKTKRKFHVFRCDQ